MNASGTSKGFVVLRCCGVCVNGSYFVPACQYIRLCCVQISDKAILLFFVLLSCVQDKCFANSNYVMGGPMGTIQLLFHRVLVDIHSSVASSKAIVRHKNETKMEVTLGKRRRIHDEKIIAERMILKVGEKRRRLTAKLSKFNCQSERKS